MTKRKPWEKLGGWSEETILFIDEKRQDLQQTSHEKLGKEEDSEVVKDKTEQNKKHQAKILRPEKLSFENEALIVENAMQIWTYSYMGNLCTFFSILLWI